MEEVNFCFKVEQNLPISEEGCEDFLEAFSSLKPGKGDIDQMIGGVCYRILI